MNANWDEWLSSMGHAYEVVQPEFTWSRVNTDNADHASWIYEIIDVVGSNCKFYSPKVNPVQLHVEVMTCLIQVHQIIGLWVSVGPVRRKHENQKIHLTILFTDLFHRGCLITQNSNVLQMTVLIYGLLTETVGSLVCRPLLLRFALPTCSTHVNSRPRGVKHNLVQVEL